MTTKVVLSQEVYFSYGQFMVYDQDVQHPGFAWEEEHTAQGFARQDSVVSIGTLLNFGDAHVSVSVGDYEVRQEYERVIAVPFKVTSGIVRLNGPDELEIKRNFVLPRGNYRFVSAQHVSGDHEEVIDLFFEPRVTILETSAILVADDALSPPAPLVEFCKFAFDD